MALTDQQWIIISSEGHLVSLHSVQRRQMWKVTIIQNLFLFGATLMVQGKLHTYLYGQIGAFRLFYSHSSDGKMALS